MLIADMYDPKNYMIHKEISGDLEHTSDWLFMLTDYLEYKQWCDAGPYPKTFIQLLWTK